MTAVVFGAIPLWRSIVIPPKLNEGGRGNTASRSRLPRTASVDGRTSRAGADSAHRLGSRGPQLSEDSRHQSWLQSGVGHHVQHRVAGSAHTSTRASAVAAHQAILDRVSVLPGVTSATASTCLPLSFGCFGNTVQVQGRPFVPGTTLPSVLFRAVGAGYFETMGIPLHARPDRLRGTTSNGRNQSSSWTMRSRSACFRARIRSAST